MDEASPEVASEAAPSADIAEPVSHQDKVADIIQDVGDKIEQRETAKQKPRSPIGQFARPTGAQPEPAIQESKVAVPGPIAWKTDMRERFATLPPDLQQYILQREDSAHGKISELGQPAAEARALSEVTERYRDVLPADMPSAVIVEHLLAAHKQIESDPAGSIKQLAESYGLDLGKLAGGEAQPAFDHMGMAEFHLQAIKEARAEARAEALVEQFAGSIQDWDVLAPEIYGQAVALRQANPDMPVRDVLNKAHERAKQLSEQFIQKREAEKAQADREAQEKAAAEQRKRATEAKRHVSMNVKSVSAAPVRKGNWEETLRDVGNRVLARG